MAIWSPPERPVVATIAAVVRDGRVLMVRRRNPPDAGRWGFPGGRVELGETIAEAAIRELREETGVEGMAGRVFDAVDVIDRAEDGSLRFHYVLVAVLCRWIAGEGAAADDALETAWMRPDDIRAAETAFSLDVYKVAEQALRLTSG